MNRDIDNVRNVSMKLHEEEVERYRALLDYNILDTGSEECFDELARLAAYICKTPVALISFVDENREWLKSVIGIDTDLKEVTRDKSFGTYVINHPDEMLAITNPLEDERTKLNPFLNSHPEIKFIAGVPITDRNEYRIGSICVLSYQPKDLSFEQISLLQTVARKVILELEQRRGISDDAEQVLEFKMDEEKTHAENGMAKGSDSKVSDSMEVDEADLSETVLADIEIKDINDDEENPSAIRKDLRDMISHLERQNRKLILLCEMDELLQASHDEEEVYTIVTNYGNKLFTGESGALFIYNDNLNILESVSYWGEKINGEQEFLPDRCWALRLGRLHSAYNSPTELYCQHLNEAEKTNYFCAPMLARGKTLGLLYLQNGSDLFEGVDAQQENNYNRHIVSTMAKLAALALGNIRHHAALQNYAIYDSLTGLFNRRYMEETLKREISRVARNKEPLGLIMIDIDHFKRFNDSYGHAAGDMQLRSIGDFFKDRIRREDIACRYGGEEFVLILPGSSLENTCRRAEQLHEEIKLVRVRHRGSFISSVEVSMGVVVFSEHGTSPELLLESADRALYKAKAQGRNRIVVA